MKWIDLPPVWLAACAGVVWLMAGQGSAMFGGQSLLGLVLILVGLGLMGAAVWTMTRQRTTVIPHQQASALVTSGIFGYSRNPIYLGDALVLCGLILRWMPPVWVIMIVPFFMLVITKRFIQPEEAMLRKTFGTAFDTYCNRVRRWV